jgi:urease accessory protein
MQLISAPLAESDSARPEIAVRVDRLILAKRRWRGAADDGMEFGCELAAPLRDGDVIWQTTLARYVIRQPAEPVVEVSLELAPSAAAGIGWAVGNLHLELAAEATRLLAPDEPAVRQLLERLNVSFKPVTAIFRPGRFARGHLPTHELGPSHKH